VNDEGKTPVLLAIEAGNVFSEDNVCVALLERGVKLDEEIWHKLLILSINYDIVAYPTLAFRHSIEIHNVCDETKISFHKAVCCLAVKIIKLYTECYGHLDLVKIIDEPDFQGVNAMDYAKLTERP
jgi:ankyrin repeat protein